eukprot:1592123-Lingulodinium_polyedra.AAC.1
MKHRASKAGARRPWLSRVRGFHSHMIRYDFMHTFCCNGVASWAIGNTLDELLDCDAFGKFRGDARMRKSL